MKALFVLCCCCLLGCAGPPPPFHARTLAEEGHPVAFRAANWCYLRLDANGVLVADAETLAEADTLLWRDMGPPLLVLQKGDRFLSGHGHYNYKVNANASEVGFGERFIWHEQDSKTYLKTSSNHYLGFEADSFRIIVQHYHPVEGSPLLRIDL